MIHLHAIVDDGDDDVRAAARDVPGTAQLRVRARRAAELARVAQMPLVTEQRIVRRETLPHLHEEIRLRPLDLGTRGEAIHLGENFVGVGTGQREEELMDGAFKRLDPRPRRAERRAGIHAGLETDDEIRGRQQTQSRLRIDEDRIGRATRGRGAELPELLVELHRTAELRPLFRIRRAQDADAMPAPAFGFVSGQRLLLVPTDGESAGQAAQLARSLGRRVGVARLDALEKLPAQFARRRPMRFGAAGLLGNGRKESARLVRGMSGSQEQPGTRRGK